MFNVKITVRDNKERAEAVKAELAKLRGMKIQIGVFGSDEYAMIAEVHEFGRTIYVPPHHKTTYHKLGKDYAFKKGFAKKKSANFAMRSQSKGYSIRIPARPFIRGTFDKKKAEIDAAAHYCIQSILRGTSAEVAYQQFAMELQGLTQSYLTELKTPANKPSTIKKKKSSNPLVDTGELKKRIAFKVVKGAM
ncbi:MAG: hypothetical protein ACRDDX_10520 [Cellulosilyticaceae bacterium]